MTPEELQTLLKSRDHQMVMKGKDEWSNISDIDLGRILDRSDLMEKWVSKCEGKPGRYSIYRHVPLVANISRSLQFVCDL